MPELSRRGGTNNASPAAPETAKTIDFSRLELGKHLLAARIDRRHVELLQLSRQ
jgi:hypothetical protein